MTHNRYQNRWTDFDTNKELEFDIQTRYYPADYDCPEEEAVIAEEYLVDGIEVSYLAFEEESGFTYSDMMDINFLALDVTDGYDDYNPIDFP